MELDNTKRDLKAMKVEVETIYNESKSSRIVTEQQEDLISSLTQEIAEHIKANDKKSKQIENVKQTMRETLQSTEKSIELLELEQKDLEKDLKEKTCVEQDLKKVEKDLEDRLYCSTASITDLEIKLSAQTQTVASLRSDIRRVSRQNEEQSLTITAELDQLHEELVVKNRKIRDDEEKAMNIRREKEELERKVSKCTKELAASLTSIDRLEREITSNEGFYEKEIDSLRHELRQVSDQHSKLKNETNTQNVSHEKSRREIEEFEIKMKNNDIMVGNLQEELTTSKQTAATLRTEFRGLIRKNDEHDQDKEKFQNEISLKTRDINMLEQELKAIKKTMEDTVIQSNNFKMDNKKITAQLAELMKILNERENENQNLHGRLAEIEDLKERIAGFEIELKEKKSKIESSEKALASQKATVASLRSGTKKLVASTEEQLFINKEEMDAMHKDSLRKARKLTKQDRYIKAISEERDKLKKDLEIVNWKNKGKYQSDSEISSHQYEESYVSRIHRIPKRIACGEGIVQNHSSEFETKVNHISQRHSYDHDEVEAKLSNVNSTTHARRKERVDNHFQGPKDEFEAKVIKISKRNADRRENRFENHSQSSHSQMSDQDDFEAKVRGILNRRKR